MVLPANAYFVQGQCSNDVNAGCGIRCKAGYQLIGSSLRIDMFMSMSLRLCTEEGIWSGHDVICEGEENKVNAET
jgi:sushi, von Willebrand factor type A, EGF and pentraxin domain-containing protein 1